MTSEKDNFSGSKFRSLALGAMLIIVGGLILLGQLFRINIWGFLWPFFIIIPGALIYSLGLVKGGSSGEGAIIPGSIITMVGVLLLYQNTFNHFESWAYAWALVAPTSIGLGQMFFGLLKDRNALVKSGTRLATTGIVIFLVGAIFFELIIGISGFGLSRWGLGRFVWPILLIGLGILLLFRSFWIRGSTKVSQESSGAIDLTKEEEQKVKEPGEEMNVDLVSDNSEAEKSEEE